MNIGPGQLTIRPVSATISHNTEWFGKMDPYLEFEFQGQSKKSQVCKGGGTKPTWSDRIIFNRIQSYLLNVKLWDYEKLKAHDLIASNEINILGYLQQGRVETEIELLWEGETGARVKIGFEFRPLAMGNQQQGQGQQVGLTSIMDSRRHNTGMYNQPQPVVNAGYPIQNPYQNAGSYMMPQPVANHHQQPQLQQHPGYQTIQNPFTNSQQNPYSNGQQQQRPTQPPQQQPSIYNSQRQNQPLFEAGSSNDPFAHPQIPSTSIMRPNKVAAQQPQMQYSSPVKKETEVKPQPTKKSYTDEEMDRMLGDD